MKTAILLVAASAALASAQLKYDETTGQYTCPKPGQAYCAGDSLSTNIIIRCDANGIGHGGNCNDNLSGNPPVGVVFSPCWQSSTTSGDAACSKNCIVYGGSGNYNGPFTLPADKCTPTYTASSTSSASRNQTTLTSTTAHPSISTQTPPATLTTTFVYPPLSTGPSSSIPAPSGNGTATTGKSTHTPVGPTRTASTSTSIPTGGAAASRVSGALAALGLVAAALL